MCKLLLRSIIKWRVWRTILLGQFLSLLLCCTGITSQLLQSNYGIKIPTGQSFVNYAFLCIIFTSWLALRGGERGLIEILKRRGWKYFILSFIDVEANYLITKSFQFTSLTSVQLLDCFTIPVVLLLSWIFLKVRFGIIHVIGVGISLIGVGSLVYADIENGVEQSSNPALKASNRFLGDMMCISGAALYGISNVTQEYVVKSKSIVEFLGMIGLFGSIINGLQFLMLERKEISNLDLSKWTEVSLLLVYSASLLLFYISMPLVLQISSSTSVNISLLSADFYSLIFGLIIFNFKYHWLYLLSFFLVIIGVLLYNILPVESIVDHSGPEMDMIEQDDELNGFIVPFIARARCRDDDYNYKEDDDAQYKRCNGSSRRCIRFDKEIDVINHDQEESFGRSRRRQSNNCKCCNDPDVVMKRNYDTMSSTTTLIKDADGDANLITDANIVMDATEDAKRDATMNGDAKIVTISEKCSQTDEF